MTIETMLEKFFKPDIELLTDEKYIVRGYIIRTPNGMRAADKSLDFIGKTVDECESMIGDICWQITAPEVEIED